MLEIQTKNKNKQKVNNEKPGNVFISIFCWQSCLETYPPQFVTILVYFRFFKTFLEVLPLGELLLEVLFNLNEMLYIKKNSLQCRDMTPLKMQVVFNVKNMGLSRLDYRKWSCYLPQLIALGALTDARKGMHGNERYTQTINLISQLTNCWYLAASSCTIRHPNDAYFSD